MTTKKSSESFSTVQPQLPPVGSGGRIAGQQARSDYFIYGRQRIRND